MGFPDMVEAEPAYVRARLGTSQSPGGEMLAVALAHRDARVPVASIARHFGVGCSTLSYSLAAYDEADATGRQPAPAPGTR
ncbi:hypothetical protein [Streptomyces sp. NPDC058812]|uniref:hypothetical protein n=1 Tax=unclassified Streptomyces TaxID=2593676 RepID=UPI00368B6AF5